MNRTTAFAIGVLLAAPVATPSLAETPKPAVEQPCKAAAARVRYGTILTLSKALKAEIAAYRSGWAAACARGGGSSLGALLVRAERIKTGIMKAVAARRPQGKTAQRLHDELSKIYPTFVPAMTGSIMEFEFFEPMLEVYKAHLQLGDREDREFFAAHSRLFGSDFKAPPWIERTWDYGGCIRLGRWSPNGAPRPGYDFLAAAGDIARLKVVLRNAWYREKVIKFENRMLRTLSTLPQRRGAGKKPLIDACGTAAEAEAEMRRIVRGLRTNHSAYRRAAAAVRRTLQAVAAGRVRICEKASCPGG